ncbi:hypothetical protein C6P41_003855 [Kluyveromyces marxianus]|nr:hypothetical protein C6P41_003855 [Kluyveromyces marxianus]
MTSMNNGWGSYMDRSVESSDIGSSSGSNAQEKYLAPNESMEIIQEHPEEDNLEIASISHGEDGVLGSVKKLFAADSIESSKSLTKNSDNEQNAQADYYTPNSAINSEVFDANGGEKNRRFVNAPVIDPNYYIGIDTIPIQKQTFIAKNGGRFTMMVVGQSGLGKTTFINTLFGTSLLPTVWEGDLSDREVTKTTKIVRHESELVEGDFALKFTVIDTPGFGDHANNSFSWSPIVNYIDEQYRSYIFQEEQPLRGSLKDNRIHCCLYFIKLTRHGLSALDIAAMEEISKRVNLIPIIAKVDGLTPDDVSIYKKNIRETIQKQQIKVCAFLDQNDPNCQTIFDMYPFGIVCSDEMVPNEEGKLVRGRKYKWGNVEVENPEHSEFTALRTVLMSKNLVDLVVGCENYYERCRTHMLLSRINQAKVNNPDFLESSGLNLEDPNQNGLDNYKFYETFNKKFMDELIIEWSPEFIHKQLEAKKRLNEIVSLEEKRFKDWKQDLLNKQNLFNHEIEDLHTLVQQIRSECNEMEAKANKQRARRFSRLGLSSHSELAK